MKKLPRGAQSYMVMGAVRGCDQRDMKTRALFTLKEYVRITQPAVASRLFAGMWRKARPLIPAPLSSLRYPIVTRGA